MYFSAAISNLILLIPAFALFHTGILWALCAGLILIMVPGTMYLSINAAVQSELFLRESAGRPLIGSVPMVSTRSEALELEKGQDGDEFIDTATMLLTKGPGPGLRLVLSPAQRAMMK